MITKKTLNTIILQGTLALLSSYASLFSLSMEMNKTTSSTAELSEAIRLYEAGKYCEAFPLFTNLSYTCSKPAKKAAACLYLGEMAQYGRGMIANSDKACSWFLLCSQHAHMHDVRLQTISLCKLAAMYFEQKNYLSALSYCERAIACTTDPENASVLNLLEHCSENELEAYHAHQAQVHYYLGDIYYYGYCGETNYLKAAQQLETGLEKDVLSDDRIENQVIALVQLGQVYDKLGLLKKAEECYEKAVLKKNSSGIDLFMGAFALISVAQNYQLGTGGKQKNNETARQLFALVIDSNHGNFFARAYSRMRLGDIFAEGGYGVTQCYRLAAINYTYGADQSDEPGVMIRCARIVGDIYSQGRPGISLDFDKARTYYEKVVKQNDCNKSTSKPECTLHHHWSLARLGDLYFQGGNGLALNALVAREYYHRVATNSRFQGLFEWAAMREGECYLLASNKSHINYKELQHCFENALARRTDLVQIEESLYNEQCISLGLRAKARAAYYLGELNFLRMTEAHDLKKAQEYYEQAGAVSQIYDSEVKIKSWMRLAEIHYCLGRNNKEEHYTKSIAYIEAVLKDGTQDCPNIKARAEMLMGKMLLKGRGVSRNAEKARLAFERAISAPQADSNTRRTAHQKLSVIYSKGLGTHIDQARVEAHLKKSQEL